jgi:Zn-dependent protease/CBS domain-containing protein
MKLFFKQLDIFKLAGIPIRIDYSWFVIFLIYTWTISTYYLPTMAPKLAWPLYWLIGIATTLLLFISVLTHELAHAYVARREGIGIHSITLYIFGGLAQLDREATTPGADFKIAVAGPAASLLLGLLFYLIAQALYFGAHLLAASKAFLHLSAVNLVVACFNLLPGFPMDGGRILRAIIWHWRKDFHSATHASLKWGATIAIALIGAGVMTIFLQHDWLAGMGSILTGLLLVRLLYAVAPDMLRTVRKSRAAAPVAKSRPSSSNSRTVREAMIEKVAIARPNMLVSEFIETVLAKRAHSSFPVVEERRLHGILLAADLDKLPPARRAITPVREVMQPVAPEHFVARDLPLEEAAARLKINGFGHAAVLDNEGLLVGYLSLTDLKKK